MNTKIVVVLSTIALIGGLFVFQSYNSEPKNNILVKTPIPQSYVTTENINADLLDVKAKETVFLPETISVEEINLNQLPRDISFLIDSEITPNISRLNFDNKKSGFEISYLNNQDLFNSYFDFIEKKVVWGKNIHGWKILVASRADLVGLIDLENTNYQAKYQLTYVDMDRTEVIITLIRK